MNYVSIVAQITINKYPKSNKSQSHAEARGADAWDRGRSVHKTLGPRTSRPQNPGSADVPSAKPWDRGRPVRKNLGPRTSRPPSADETSAPPCCGLDRFGYNSAG